VRLLLSDFCDALWLAHSKGIVHRDLKPDNVFVVQNEGAIQPTLVDLASSKSKSLKGETNLTKAGDVLGSPDYMSPEQARGLDERHPLDRCLVILRGPLRSHRGRTPFKGANYNALLRQIVEGHSAVAAGAFVRRRGAIGDHHARAQQTGGPALCHDGELGRALASWLLGQGRTEDICGTTIEAKVAARTPDSPQRAGRATMASITEAWAGGQGLRLRGSA